MDSYEEWINQTGELLFKELGLYIDEIEIELLFYFQLGYTPEQMVSIVAKPLNKLILETIEHWLF